MEALSRRIVRKCAGSIIKGNKRTLMQESAFFFYRSAPDIRYIPIHTYEYCDKFVQNPEYRQNLLTIPTCCAIIHT